MIINKIQKIRTHVRFHLDEAVAIWLLITWGENFFRGICDAVIEFQFDEPSPSHDCVDVGIGGGQFDEHRPHGRLQNECATTLVASYLRVCNKPGVRKLLEETLFADTKPGVKPSQLANLIKAMHRVRHGENQIGVMRWAWDGIDAIVFGQVDPRHDLRASWEAYCADKGTTPPMEVTRLINLSFSRRNELVTELSAICQRMNPEVRQDWLVTTFDMLVNDNRMFESAVKEVVERGDTSEVETAHGPEPLVCIRSNNEHINRACASVRTGKTGLTIVRNTNGLTQIYGNPNLPDLNLTGLVQMLRMAEYRAWTGQSLPLRDAIGEGTIAECEQWHLPNGNIILNGSLTHPAVRPSKLSLEEIRDIAMEAFIPVRRAKWLENYQNLGLTLDLN